MEVKVIAVAKLGSKEGSNRDEKGRQSEVSHWLELRFLQCRAPCKGLRTVSSLLSRPNTAQAEHGFSVMTAMVIRETISYLC